MPSEENEEEIQRFRKRGQKLLAGYAEARKRRMKLDDLLHNY
ncbi:hypothetical protein [Alistipes communis]|jgi:hypothetical protein|nr:hypothetical protein [Alistipes communis]